MGLEGVEIVMAWEEAFGIDIPDSVARRLSTASDAIDYIFSQVSSTDAVSCVSRRAFFILRQAIVTGLNVPRGTVQPGTRLLDLLPKDNPRRAWKQFGIQAKLNPWPRLPWRAEHLTVGELAKRLVGEIPAQLAPNNGRWSRSEVREVVRAVVIEEARVPATFDDTARFYADLGIN